MISICFISTNITLMYPKRKLLFARMCSTFRAGLRRSIGIDTGKIDLMFLRHPRKPVEELTKSPVKSMFSQHSSGHRFEVQILNKNHPNTFLGTEMVSQLELPIFPLAKPARSAYACNVVVESGNLDSSFLAVLR